VYEIEQFRLVPPDAKMNRVIRYKEKFTYSIPKAEIVKLVYLKMSNESSDIKPDAFELVGFEGNNIKFKYDVKDPTDFQILIQADKPGTYTTSIRCKKSRCESCASPYFNSYVDIPLQAIVCGDEELKEAQPNSIRIDLTIGGEAFIDNVYTHSDKALAEMFTNNNKYCPITAYRLVSDTRGSAMRAKSGEGVISINESGQL
jgi:hypothetical protein